MYDNAYAQYCNRTPFLVPFIGGRSVNCHSFTRAGFGMGAWLATHGHDVVRGLDVWREGDV